MCCVESDRHIYEASRRKELLDMLASHEVNYLSITLTVQLEDEAGMLRSGAGLALTRYSSVDIMTVSVIQEFGESLV